MIRLSLPDGETPHVEVQQVESSEGRTLWQVLTVQDGHAARFWPGVQVHILERLIARAGSSMLDGYRPPWMELRYQPEVRHLPSPRRTRRGRMVRPLDYPQLLHDNSYPWVCMGLISNSDGFTGSGTLVSSRLVLTASHCVPWKSVNSGWGWWMTFAPNFRSLDVTNHTPFGQSFVSDVLCYRQVAGGQHDFFDTAQDYAVLRLYDPVAERVGFHGCTDYNEDWNDRNVWATVGYPSGVGPFVETSQSIEDGDSPGIFGQGAGLDLETEATLLEGMSGGPFWAWFDTGGGNRTPRITGVVSGIDAVAANIGAIF